MITPPERLEALRTHIDALVARRQALTDLVRARGTPPDPAMARLEASLRAEITERKDSLALLQLANHVEHTYCL